MEEVKTPSVKSKEASPARVPSPDRGSRIREASKIEPDNEATGDNQVNTSLNQVFSNLEPQGQNILDHVEELTNSVKLLTDSAGNKSPIMGRNIEKIAQMSRVLTSEANALRESIKQLNQDISTTKKKLKYKCELDVNFPYHLFLVELIVNKIHMKCDCFEIDYNNLVISATYLGKPPVILYDASYGKINNFDKINVGKSALFAMTYDKICNIDEFEIVVELTKQPPCTSCITKIAVTRIDFTKEFQSLREEVCTKWSQEQPKDDILCTTSTPLNKNMYYLMCGDNDSSESIGVMEMSIRLSFLGKEITTAFTGYNKKHMNTAFLNKDDNGVSMYSCQKVEMDDEGTVLLDEETMGKKNNQLHKMPYSKPMSIRESPSTQYSEQSMELCPYARQANRGQPQGGKYDEIFTKMNDNELKIRVPKTTRVERSGKYDRIQDLCTCESMNDNRGDQLQFELPSDLCRADQQQNQHTSNIKYTYKGCDRRYEGKKPQENLKDKRTINITPTNCPAQLSMEKMPHPRKDVFILKIGKKLETKDKKTDLEIELVTPKLHSDPPLETNVGQQYSSQSLRSKGSKKAGLGEFRIRDLNDEINKLMREKRHWEVQIKFLGGPDHARVGPKMLDQDGKEVPGNRGYKYFGAAKDLPGVRELFEQEPPPPPRRTRADLMRDVDADYYGYRDDDDGLLGPLEKQAEKISIAQAVAEWKSNKEQNKDQDIPEEENIYPEDPEDKRAEEDDPESSEATRAVAAHVAVPSQKDVEEALLRRKKQELLEKYGCLDVKMES